MLIGNTLSYSPDMIMWRSPPLIPGIQCVFLVTAQPAEITAVGTVLIGTRHDKAQEFVPVSSPSGITVRLVACAPRNPFGFTKVPVSTLPLM